MAIFPIREIDLCIFLLNHARLTLFPFSKSYMLINILHGPGQNWNTPHFIPWKNIVILPYIYCQNILIIGLTKKNKPFNKLNQAGYESHLTILTNVREALRNLYGKGKLFTVWNWAGQVNNAEEQFPMLVYQNESLYWARGCFSNSHALGFHGNKLRVSTIAGLIFGSHDCSLIFWKTRMGYLTGEQKQYFKNQYCFL